MDILRTGRTDIREMHEAIIFFFTFSCNFKSIVISEVRHLATSGSSADGEAHMLFLLEHVI